MIMNLGVRYAPKITEQQTTVKGHPITYAHMDYGHAHALRQVDAESALNDITDLNGAVMLKVECRDRIIARVYRTKRADELDLIVAMTPPGKDIDSDLHNINADTGRTGDHRITYTDATVLDPLRAPDDRDLEHVCKCGQLHNLDRRMMLERVAMGQRVATVDEVTTP